MFDVFYIGKRPCIHPHERRADSLAHARSQSRTRYCWIISYLADYTDFDFLWEPLPWQSHYTHVWPSQWHDFSGTYLVPCDTDKLEYHFHSRIIPNRDRPWDFEFLVDHIEFDTTWSPHPLDPDYVYVFGNQWWNGTIMPTVRYCPNSSLTSAHVKYPTQPVARLLEKHDNKWHTLIDCEWDYSWCPDPGDPPYIYVFGNQWHRAEIMPTVEYHAPGATERKFMSWPQAGLLPDESLWEIPDNIDSSDVDFSWCPDPGSPPYIYQFATQHQKTGGPVYRMPNATEIKFVNQLHISAAAVATHVYLIDHLDGNVDAVYDQLPLTIERSRYFDNYLDTLRRIARNAQAQGHEFIWIASSVCDYRDFDWSWHPEKWQASMLHVFASDGEKFGDTFFMHVPTFIERAERCKLLEWYDVNYVPEKSVSRRPMPVIQHDMDSQVSAVKNISWSGPLALFATRDMSTDRVPCVPLWRRETRAVTPITQGAGLVIVPKDAVADVQEQIYDYAHINRSHNNWIQDPPLDIVFISNGETNADQNWSTLLLSKQGAPNRCVRIDGVNGRAAAYHAAAEASETAWFFAVFAKLEVVNNFDWSWQPDRLQQPKHYIFHALNPVNQLEYGHQAMIAYNRKLTLANPGRGLDFTLDDAHETVPILSGVARYNIDPWTTWRTAFRETLKLRHSLPDIENQYRLEQWLKKSSGPYGKFSVYGAEDAMNYYDEVNGDFVELRKSYEWSWLASYALVKRNLIPLQL